METKIHGTFKYLLLSRGFRSVAIIYMSLAFSLYLNALKIALVDIGIIAAATMLFMVVLIFILGFVGDRYGYKIEMLIAEVIAFSGALIITLSGSLAYISFGMIIAGLGGGAGGIRGAFSPGSSAFVANNYDKQDERTEKFSYINIVSSLCAIIGSVLLISVSVIGAHTGMIAAYKYMFLLSTLLLGASILSLLMLSEAKRPRKTTIIMKKSSVKYSLKVIAANMFSGASIGIVIPLLPLWFALSYHVSTADVGVIFIFVYIATAFGSFISSKISHIFNHANAAAYSLIASGAMFFVMAISPTILLAAAAYILRAIFSGFGNPFRKTVNLKGIDQQDYGTATSAMAIASRTAQMSSGISGYLMDYALPLPLFVGGILQIFGGIGYKMLFGKKKIEPKSERIDNL